MFAPNAIALAISIPVRIPPDAIIGILSIACATSKVAIAVGIPQSINQRPSAAFVASSAFALSTSTAGQLVPPRPATSKA